MKKIPRLIRCSRYGTAEECLKHALIPGEDPSCNHFIVMKRKKKIELIVIEREYLKGYEPAIKDFALEEEAFARGQKSIIEATVAKLNELIEAFNKLNEEKLQEATDYCKNVKQV